MLKSIIHFRNPFTVVSERIFQRELQLPRRKQRVDRTAETRRFEDAHRDAKMRPVPDVEDLGPEDQSLTFSHAEVLDQREVSLGNAAGAEGIAAHSAVLT